MIQSQNTHLYSKNSKKYFNFSKIFSKHKISNNILKFTPHKKFDSLPLQESPILRGKFQEIYSVGHDLT